MKITDQEVLEALSDAVRIGNGVRIPVSGRSMGPGFASVSDIVVEPFNPATVSLGSIIVFLRGGRWIVHRVIWKFGRRADAFCITKGDNLVQIDRPYVKASEIQGTVVGLGTRQGAAIDLTSGIRRWTAALAAMRGWLAVGLSGRRKPRPA